MTPDIVNASFEMLAACFSLLNIRQALKDREIKGVSPWPTVFFTTWGFWNLFYYPFLQQTWSAAAAVAMVSVNLWWLYLYKEYKNAST